MLNLDMNYHSGKLCYSPQQVAVHLVQDDGAGKNIDPDLLLGVELEQGEEKIGKNYSLKK